MKVAFEPGARADPEMAGGVRVPYAPAKRQAAVWRWRLVLGAVLSPLAYVVFMMLAPYLVTSCPGLLAHDALRVTAPVAGLVVEAPPRPGDSLETGGLLVRLSQPELDGQRRILAAELTALERSEPAPEDPAPRRAVARPGAPLAREVERSRLRHLETVRGLVERGAATAAELDEAQERYNQARLAVMQTLPAQPEPEPAKPRPDSPERQARLARLRAEIAEIDARRQELRLETPAAGLVLEMNLRQGQTVAPGAPVALLALPGRPRVEAYLEPKQARLGRTGTPAMVALPTGDRLRAQVEEMSYRIKPRPAELAQPFSSGLAAVVVRLRLLDDPPSGLALDSLPVSVEFTNWRDWLPSFHWPRLGGG